MKTLRFVLLKLHLWIGLGAGLLMAFLAVTGALLVWTDEIDRLLNPSIMTVKDQPGVPRLTTSQLLDKFQSENRGLRAQGFYVSHRPTIAPYAIVRLDRVYFDPYTGKVLGRRDVRKGFMFTVHQLHTRLSSGVIGEKIVGWTNVAMLFIVVSGIWLWWKRLILTTRRVSSWWRINFDLHNITGIYSAIFLIAMCLSGVLMSFGGTFAPLIYKVTGEPPDVDTPEVEWQKGVRPISWDQALEIGDKALPGAMSTFVTAPNPRRGFYQISYKFPSDGTPGGRSRVMVNGQTGEVLQVVDSRVAHPGVKVFNLNRPLHTGDIGGITTRILWFVAAMLVLAQAVTGFLIWWKRYLTNRALAKREQKVVEEDVFA